MPQTKYLLVRLKTYDRHLGQLARRYTYQGKRFEIDKGWYKVARSVANEIAELKHPSTGALMFDVVEEDVADEIDTQETTQDWAAKSPKAGQAAPVPTRDFTRRKEVKEAEYAREHIEDEGTMFDDEFDPAKDKKVEEDQEKPAKKRTGRPKKRSATK